jgi:protein TonB
MTAPVATPAPEPGLGKQAEMMKSQLNAPSKISNDLKALGGSQPAPNAGFSPAGMDMNGSSPVFSTGNGPKVKVEAPKKVTISNGIAVGLLVQKTAPIYPPIAKSARVQGTVVIQATISKNGTIENSHAVSGPTMLRQAALDAVKSWRFRPYLLDGEPVEVDTTVNVVFNLGG